MDWQTQEVDHKESLRRNSGIICWQTSCSCNGIFIIPNALFDLLSMTFDKQYIYHANGIFNVKQNIQNIQITRLSNYFFPLSIWPDMYCIRNLHCLFLLFKKVALILANIVPITLGRNMHKINLNNKNLRNHLCGGKVFT